MQGLEQERYKAYNARTIRDTPYWQKLTPALQEAMDVVARVMPFRTNEYVLGTLDAELRQAVQSQLSADPALAQHTARMMLIDPDRQSQAPYISLALTERPRHSLTEKAEHFLQKELHREISIAELARHCGTSERSLLRHFHQTYGASPLAHLQHLRVERAKALLDLYGYVDKDGDGWRDQPDGRPLVLQIATEPEQIYRLFNDVWRRCMTARATRASMARRSARPASGAFAMPITTGSTRFWRATWPKRRWARYPGPAWRRRGRCVMAPS